MSDLQWPRLHWVHMCLIGLAEAEFNTIPEWAAQKLRNLFVGFPPSKLVEDVIRVLRKAGD